MAYYSRELFDKNRIQKLNEIFCLFSRWMAFKSNNNNGKKKRVSENCMIGSFVNVDECMFANPATCMNQYGLHIYVKLYYPKM